MSRNSVPIVAATFAAAWLAGTAMHSTAAAAILAATAMPLASAAALCRRRGRARTLLTAGLGALGAVLAGTLLLRPSIPLLLATAAALLLPIPLLYAVTFSSDGEDT